jgi:hypothetical protein
MTESDWWACQEPQEMLQHLVESRKGSGRKLRLFAIACCRRIWPLLSDERSRKAVEVAERYADGEVGEADLEVAYETFAREEVGWAGNAAWCAAEPGSNKPLHLEDHCFPLNAACSAAHFACLAVGDPNCNMEVAEQAALVRDIFGPWAFQAKPPIAKGVRTWNDGCVVKVAASIYEEATFDRLPVLGDALEEAGVTDEEVLAHLRSPGPHCRGCWVVDLVLGKE